ncbi:MAG: HdeD family acid-resistance protein [Dehalococcoidia bacterium]
MMKFDTRLRETAAVTKWWWVFLVTGILWLVMSLIVFRFDLTSAGAVGALVGALILVAGVNEFGAMNVTDGGWRWVHAILGGIFVVFGVIALFNPWDTFVATAAIIGWVLLFKGIFDIVVAFMTKHENEMWWLLLIVGGAELLLAFWAAGYFGQQVVILIAWAGAWCLVRGITEIILAFQLRGVHKRAEMGTLASPAGAPMPEPAESGPSAAPA